jgi:transcriptional regulator with XRE-family HTH domain
VTARTPGGHAGQRLRAHREALGWTKKHAAQHLGVRQETYGRWERTGVVSRTEHRRRLEDWLDDKSAPEPPAPRILASDLKLPGWTMPRHLLTGPVTPRDQWRDEEGR